jgi:acyl dehydratase
MPRLFFEDFTPGWTETFGPVTVTKEELVAFASEFDPQPFHTDEDAAKDTFVGTLIASGWHTCALTMRLIADGFLLDAAAQGAPGIEEVKWLRPVLPGDSLRARIRVVESRVSRNRPEIGLARFETQVLNGRDEAVMTQANWIMFARRGTPWPPAPGTGPDASAATVPHPPRTREEDLALPSPYLEDLETGGTIELGTATFTPEAIVRFAKAYDPQLFHVDPEAARNSLFGGLCASGWHTAAAWMRLMVEHRRRSHAAALARGQRPALLGPSPGFRNLRWTRPVFAGDRIAYRTTLTEARPSASRPGWGIAFHRNSGVNQHGEEVFSFDGAVLWQRRP